jgi:hypothetical protein
MRPGFRMDAPQDGRPLFFTEVGVIAHQFKLDR